MTAHVIAGPWRPRRACPGPEGLPFDALPTADQIRLLAFALRDLRRYWSDLTGNERGWLLAQLPAVRPLRPDHLDPQERARVADVAATVLRRRAGWAC